MPRTGYMISVMSILALAGCGSPHGRPSSECSPETMAAPSAWEGIKRIAVFPPDNWTIDVGPEYVAWYRAVLQELLLRKGYEVVPLVRINEFMTRNRFVLAGELGLYSSKELATEFQADALLFWDILEIEKTDFWDGFLFLFELILALFTWDFDDLLGDSAEWERDVQLICTLLKADGTKLWSSGHTRLDLPYPVLDSALAGSPSQQGWMSITLGEILRQVPERK